MLNWPVELPTVAQLEKDETTPAEFTLQLSQRNIFLIPNWTQIVRKFCYLATKAWNCAGRKLIRFLKKSLLNSAGPQPRRKQSEFRYFFDFFCLTQRKNLWVEAGSEITHPT